MIFSSSYANYKFGKEFCDFSIIQKFYKFIINFNYSIYAENK